MSKADLLTPNVRSDTGRPEAWRDYQQAFAEVGAVYSTMLTGGKIVVTPVAEALLDGEIDYPQFLTIQALRYQYPNGLKRTLQKNLKSKLKRTKYANLKTLIDVQLDAGIRLKPFLLLLQVMRHLIDLGASPYLTREEMQRFLVYESDNNHAEEVARRVLGFRQNRGPVPPIAGDSRNFNDIITFLGRTGIFKEIDVRPPALTLKDNAPEFLRRVDELMLNEMRSFYNFKSGALDEARSWFQYYGSRARLENLFDPLELSKEIGKENVLDDFSIVKHFEEPPPLVEIGYRRLAYITRPKMAEPRPPRPPALTAILKEKGRRSHIELVKLMETKTKALRAVPQESELVDMFTKYAGKNYYFEMKTVNPANILNQVRRGISQLYEYSWVYEGKKRPGNVVLCLVFSAEPKYPSWLIDYLIQDRGIVVCWRKGDRFTCPPSCEEILKPFL
jgi:hypothetical protein